MFANNWLWEQLKRFKWNNLINICSSASRIKIDYKKNIKQTKFIQKQ